KLVLADRTGRATDAVDRPRQPASAAPPPLAHVLAPLGAFVAGHVVVVTDRQVRGAAVVGALDPHRDVRAVVLGDVQPRDLQGDVQPGGGGRGGEGKRGQRGDQGGGC